VRIGLLARRHDPRRLRLIVYTERDERPVEIGDVPRPGDPHQERHVGERLLARHHPSCFANRFRAVGDARDHHCRRRHAPLEKRRSGLDHRGLARLDEARRVLQHARIDVDLVERGVHESYSRVLFEQLEYRAQVLRVEAVVVEEDHQELGLGELDQTIEIAHHSDVLVGPHVVESLVRDRGDDGRRLVGRRVVAHDQPEVAVGLCEHAVDRLGEEARSIECRNSDRDPRARHSRVETYC